MQNILRRFGFALLVVAAGLFVGAVQSGALNGHGPGAGFAGLAVFFLLYPVMSLVCSFAALVARGTRAEVWFLSGALFSGCVVVGALSFH